MPGLLTLPTTKTLISLICARVVNASVPKSLSLTFDRIRSSTLARGNPATTTLPTSGIKTAPSALTTSLNVSELLPIN